MRRSLMVALALLALPTSAQAQFIGMDRMDASLLKAGVRFDVLVPDPNKATYLRTELYGQASFYGFGGYISFPISSTFPDLGSGLTAVGNLEIGGFVDRRLGPLHVVSRLGIGLPTATKDAPDRAANGAALMGRLTDSINTLPEALTLRMSLSPYFQMGIITVRADLGIDFALFLNSDTTSLAARLIGADQTYQAIFRGNIGIAVNAFIAQFSLDIVNSGIIGPSDFTRDRNNSDLWNHALAIGVSFKLPFIRPYIGYTVPLKDDTRKFVSAILTFGVEAGYF